ncbi:Modulator of FtsH protease YccA [Vibrio stylophorae]|uniref:Modulator of FtsH protease YccA n=1 Tax=Vibrio stylophorae TaxID=659351 RepID=A0ABN8DT65_9VIBR|nr:Bax inhibitor-1/YccA family protein [Vibrio stylophorae]CAH0533753.1 Modulator of FtsH protease YccA [Vibrio stylophorae]
MQDQIVSSREQSLLSTHKVLRNTYSLLSMTLFTSAIAAFVTMQMNMAPMMGLIMSLAALVIVWFVLPRTYNSPSGIVWTFVFTTLLGASAGPTLNYYVGLSGTGAIILQAFAMTGAIFLALSGYVLTTKKNFSFMGGFLFAGLITVLLASIIGIFFGGQTFQLAISSAIVLLFSGYILYDTSSIIHGEETNYVRATVGMYLNLFNIFMSLVRILGIMGSDD